MTECLAGSAKMSKIAWARASIKRSALTTLAGVTASACHSEDPQASSTPKGTPGRSPENINWRYLGERPFPLKAQPDRWMNDIGSTNPGFSNKKAFPLR